MLDMQVIEALYLKDKEPHDYLHIKHERANLVSLTVCGHVFVTPSAKCAPGSSRTGAPGLVSSS
jgi:hypothetical protein